MLQHSSKGSDEVWQELREGGSIVVFQRILDWDSVWNHVGLLKVIFISSVVIWDHIFNIFYNRNHDRNRNYSSNKNNTKIEIEWCLANKSPSSPEDNCRLYRAVKKNIFHSTPRYSANLTLFTVVVSLADLEVVFQMKAIASG
jgi:hypothetical protein